MKCASVQLFYCWFPVFTYYLFIIKLKAMSVFIVITLSLFWIISQYWAHGANLLATSYKYRLSDKSEFGIRNDFISFGKVECDRNSIDNNKSWFLFPEHAHSRILFLSSDINVKSSNVCWTVWRSLRSNHFIIIIHINLTAFLRMANVIQDLSSQRLCFWIWKYVMNELWLCEIRGETAQIFRWIGRLRWWSHGNITFRTFIILFESRWRCLYKCKSRWMDVDFACAHLRKTAHLCGV